MKKITEYTELEILELTIEQLNQMVKFEMAEQGIKLVSCPDEPKYKLLPEKDIEVYQVSGFNEYFVNKEDAQKICDLINNMSFMRFSYNYKDYSNRYLEKTEVSEYYVKTEKGYSKKLWQQATDDIDYNKTLKDDYTIKLKEYNESVDNAKDIKDDIYDRYKKVCSKYSRLNNLIWRFNNDYMPLYKSFEDKCEELAMIAMNKAYTLNAEEQTYILNNYKQSE